MSNDVKSCESCVYFQRYKGYLDGFWGCAFSSGEASNFDRVQIRALPISRVVEVGSRCRVHVEREK